MRSDDEVALARSALPCVSKTTLRLSPGASVIGRDTALTFAGRAPALPLPTRTRGRGESVNSDRGSL
jgi:hypothetical protein